MADETLLPCPFCGGSLVVAVGNEHEEDFRYKCVGCLATTGRYRTQREAGRSWNARALTDEVTRLREALEEADRDREKMIDEIGYWRAYAESEAGRALEDYDAERDGDSHGETE
jgi:hypothetical protein